MQSGVFELVSQKPETWDIRRPAKTRRGKTVYGNFNRISGFCALKIGPETGLILLKSRFLTSSTVDDGPSWPAELSWQ
jgi:hypothetical protein